jgi:hypothetical protein
VVRLAIICLLLLTGAAPAPPAITAQDLRDVADGTLVAEDLVAGIPPQDRVAAVHRLIRSGASCKQTKASCDHLALYAAPDAKATSKSPCFRRWHLYTLLSGYPIDQTLRLDDKELRAVVKLDDELIQLIGSLLEGEQQVSLAQKLIAQKREIPFTMQLDHTLAVKAVKQYHLDAAVELIDPDQSPQLLVGIVLDPTYKAATRIETLSRLDDAGIIDHDWLVQIVRPLLRDPSIDVASTVASLSSIDLQRPQTTDRSILMRALAIFIASSSSDADTAISYAPRGLDIISPAGEKLEHIGPSPKDGPYVDHWQLGDDLVNAFEYRIRFQPPIFGVDARGYLILVGFIDMPEPPASEDACELEMDGY